MGGLPTNDPVAASGGLIAPLPQSANPTADAFNSETTNLQNQQAAQTTNQTAQLQNQTQKDAIIGKVLEYAGNGQVDEAKFMAQKNDIQLPDQIYSNSKMAKLAAVAGQLYPDDPNKASQYMVAGMKAAATDPASSFMDWSRAGMMAAGAPLTTTQRDVNKIHALAVANSKVPLSSEKQADYGIAKAKANTETVTANTNAGYGMGIPIPFPNAGQPSAGLTATPTDPGMPAGGPPTPDQVDAQPAAGPALTPEANPTISAPAAQASDAQSAGQIPNALPSPDGVQPRVVLAPSSPAAQSVSPPQPTSATNESPFGWKNEALRNVTGLPMKQVGQMKQDADKIKQEQYNNNRLIDHQMQTLDSIDGVVKSIPGGGFAPSAIAASNYVPSAIAPQSVTDLANHGQNLSKLANQLVLGDKGFNYTPGSRGSDLQTSLIIGSKPHAGVQTKTNLSATNDLRGKYMDARISGDIDQQYSAANPYGHISGPEVDMIDRTLKQLYPITSQNAEKNTVYNAGNVAKIQALIPLTIKYGPDVLKNPEAYLKQSGFVPVDNVDSTAGVKPPHISGPDDPAFGKLQPGDSFIDNSQGSPYFGQVRTKH